MRSHGHVLYESLRISTQKFKEQAVVIERYRTNDGIKIRAGSKEHKPLFKHCAGDHQCSSRKLREVVHMLFQHGVSAIETVDHKSI